MTEQTLLLVEVTGIQDYVFSSNQLAQNVGASELVRKASTDWVYQHLPQPNNVDSPQADHSWVVTDRGLEKDSLSAEVIYTGGGNALVLFACDTEAKQFARELSRHTLESAPGLPIVLKRARFDPRTTVLRTLLRELRRDMVQRKLARLPSVPLPGLGVTAACVFTGAPAVVSRYDRLVSEEVRAKLDAESDGNLRLHQLAQQVRGMDLGFLRNFDQIGEKGESSYLALVHTDGNEMGKRFEDLGSDCTTPQQNPDYILALRHFSKSIEAAANEALNATADRLLAATDLREGLIGQKVPVPQDGTDFCLPFRPIVFGGDDVTFVCDGRLGLDLATTYLSAYSSKHLADGNPAHARAGIAVVPSHFPFSRAYDLAEELCRSAKEYISKANESEGLTALDWHFAVSGPLLDLHQIREREYRVTEGPLEMRPVRLSNPNGEWRSWETFRRIVADFQKPESEGGRWEGRRNKVMALRDALRIGSKAVRLFLQAEEPLAEIPGYHNMSIEGWHGGRCGYYDAIEALDFYVSLEGGQMQ